MSILSAGTTNSTALNITADTSGSLILASNNNVTAVTVDANQNATFASSVNAPNTFGFKNRIINGAMVIDQRNAGASVTINSAAWTYTVDRFCALGQATDGVYTAQQSSTVPTGFTKSLLVTITTADASIAAGQIYALRQTIEGYNIADLNWGTANAKSCTLSFWVRSSVTGTFSGCINNEGTASYPFTYTINAANTFEYKTVTLDGPTSGTWGSTNSHGIRLTWSLGVGSTYSGTGNVWNYSTEYFAASSTTNLIATNGATWYITGVQLETGTKATSFDYRDFSRELVLCQRYFCSSFNIGVAPAYNAGGGMIGKGANGATAEPIICWQFPVSMRTAPTVTTYNPSASNNQWTTGTTPRMVTNTTAMASVDNTGNPITAGTQSYIHVSATAEL